MNNFEIRPLADVRRNPIEPEFIDFLDADGNVLRTVHYDEARRAANVPAKQPPRFVLDEKALEDALAQLAKTGQKINLKPTHYIADRKAYLKNGQLEPLAVRPARFAAGPMHCEHLYAYCASRPRLKGIRYDAYNKMAREYHKAARDTDYAATCWRA